MRGRYPVPMSASRSSRATAVALLAGSALLASGCAADEEQQLRESLSSTQQRLDSAESRIAELEDRVDRVPDVEGMRSEASAAVSSAVDEARGSVDRLRAEGEAAARDAVDALPDLPDARSVEQATQDGRTVIEYAEDALPQDRAELERRLAEAADAVKSSVPGAGPVEFTVGDQTFTF